MSRYRRVLCRVWEDEKFVGLSEPAKLLFLYHLTSQRSTPFLLYVEGPGAMSDTLRMPSPRLSEGMIEIAKQGMIRYADDGSNLVFAPNALRLPENAPESKNAVKSWVRLIDDLPKTRFLYGCLRHWQAIAQGITHPMTQAFLKACALAYPMPSVQEQEQEQEQDLSPKPVPEGTGASSMKASEHPYKLTPPSGDREPEKPARKALVHVTAETPTEGLDQLDRCRRRYAIEWRSSEQYDGVPYPDNPGADRSAVNELLNYHQRNKVAAPWQKWMLSVFKAYLAIQDDRYLVSACHPLSLLPRNLARVVVAMNAGAA